MKNRTRKKKLDSSRRWRARFTMDTLRARSEASAGYLVPYEFLVRSSQKKEVYGCQDTLIIQPDSFDAK